MVTKEICIYKADNFYVNINIIHNDTRCVVKNAVFIYRNWVYLIFQ
jgi:hypothetical protein